MACPCIDYRLKHSIMDNCTVMSTSGRSKSTPGISRCAEYYVKVLIECLSFHACASRGNTIEGVLEMIKGSIKGHLEVIL